MYVNRVISGLLLMVGWTSALAQDANTDIAKISQTPFARNPHTQYYSLPIEDDINFNHNESSRAQQIVNFKPIVSFHLTPSYDLILRTIAPLLYHQPKTHTDQFVTGYGDLNPTAFISPAQYRTLLWGIGPTLFIPTASNKLIGSGKWSAGPELALFDMHQHWVFGILTSNVWSFAGNHQRASVNQFSFEYFISYNFSDGWFVTTQPTITSNWKASASQKWTVPFGIGGGKGFHFKDSGMSITLQSYYNAIHPANVGHWTIQMTVELDIKDDSHA